MGQKCTSRACNSSKPAPYFHPPINIPSSLVGASRNATKAQTNISSASNPPIGGPCSSAPRRKSIPKIIAEALFGVRRTSKRALRAGSCRLHLAVGLLGGTAPVGDGCYAVAHCLFLRGCGGRYRMRYMYAAMVAFLSRRFMLAEIDTRKIGLVRHRSEPASPICNSPCSLHRPV